jgi:hypothetical protein
MKGSCQRFGLKGVRRLGYEGTGQDLERCEVKRIWLRLVGISPPLVICKAGDYPMEMLDWPAEKAANSGPQQIQRSKAICGSEGVLGGGD